MSIDEILDHISPAETISLLVDLVRFNSVNPPGNEATVARHIAHLLVGIGLEATVVPVAEARANIVARLPGRGTMPALMFCGHLDTVHPGETRWSHDPFAGEIRNGRLYGRGASDMKGGIAAMLSAVVALSRTGQMLEGDVILVGTADEEVSGLGAYHMLASGGMEGVGALVIPEPTGLQLVTAHRGVVWLRLTTQGKAAHGAMPERGVNAILHMYALLDRLLGIRFLHVPHPLLAPPTVNIGTINGGTVPNIVPRLCKATADIRTVPGQSTEGIVAQVQQVISDLAKETPDFQASVEVIKDRPAVTTDPETLLIQAALRASRAVLGQALVPQGVSYTTDASVLVPPTSVPTLIFGPGEPAMAHQQDEYVEIDKVVEAAQFYTALAFELMMV